MNLDAVKDFRVLIVGDAIRDRYVFGKPLGKSTKESVLSQRYERQENYRGGVWAAAAHIAGLCARVDVMHGPLVMRSTRFVETQSTRKLFTVHEARMEKASDAFDIGSYDLVIVADFGYGTMTPELIHKVSHDAEFLAVNAQTNSNNIGFNLISRYRRADYVVIDEFEARLAAQDRESDMEDVILKLGYKKIVVTMGSAGAVGYDGRFYREPAKADRVVDTIGAGDAFLVVSSLFAKAGFGIKDLVGIGNLAGAAKVGVVGHRRPVNRSDLVDGPRNR